MYQVYRARRDELSDLSRTYRVLEPIPYMKYTEDETKTWGAIYNKLQEGSEIHACRFCRRPIFHQNQCKKSNILLCLPAAFLFTVLCFYLCFCFVFLLTFTSCQGIQGELQVDASQYRMLQNLCKKSNYYNFISLRKCSSFLI